MDIWNAAGFAALTSEARVAFQVWAAGVPELEDLRYML